MQDDQQPIASSSRGIQILQYRPPPNSADSDHEEEQDLQLNDPLLLARQELYAEAWSQVSARIRSTIAGLHDSSLNQVTTFVHTSRAKATSLLAVLSGKPLIPTGIIIGVGPGTSSLVFTALDRQLSQSHPQLDEEPQLDDGDVEINTPSLVSRLSSRDCPNLKSALRALTAGFVGHASLRENTVIDDEEEDEAGTAGTKAGALAPEDMLNLVAWYQHQLRGGREDHLQPNLVILLEDLEGMDGKVLTQMIDVLSRYISQLPIVLVIGAATSLNALHELIPRRTANLLDIERFFVEPGIGTFNSLIKNIFIDWDPPVGLGPDALNFLLQTFQDMNHSIDATISALQYLYLHHFTRNPTAIFSSSVPLKSLSAIPSETRALLQSLPSFKLLQKKNSQDALARSLRRTANSEEDMEAFRAGLEETADLHKEHRKKMREGWVVLLAVGRVWGKEQSSEGLLQMWSERVLAKYADELCGMILQSDYHKLLDFLSSTPSAFLIPLSVRNTFARLEKAPKPKGRLNLINMNVSGAAVIYQNIKLTDDDREFSKAVGVLVRGLKDGFGTAFASPTRYPLHELYYVNDPKPLTLAFHPSILPSYHATLTENATGAASEIAKDDITVAYQLYRETGKMINLGDWWSAFDQTGFNEEDEEWAAEEDEEELGRKRRRGGSEDEDEEDVKDFGRRKQARFLRCLGDLGFTGFLLPTTRKAEHVIKSVF
ncbi:hypothetical protein T439DRAFT_377780 [Meredithblackwellia eburnea MCA 4105]